MSQVTPEGFSETFPPMANPPSPPPPAAQAPPAPEQAAVVYPPGAMCDIHGAGWCGLPKGHKGHHRPPMSVGQQAPMPAAPAPAQGHYAAPATAFVPRSPEAIGKALSIVMGCIEQFYQLNGNLIVLNAVKPQFDEARVLLGLPPTTLR